MKEPDPDGSWKCVAHSDSDAAKEARARAAVAGKASQGMPGGGSPARALADADLTTAEGALEAMNAGVRELAAHVLSPQELDAITRAAKAALEWHGRAAAAPKQGSKTSTTVDYVEDGVDPAPPPDDIDEILEVGIEPPVAEVQ